MSKMAELSALRDQGLLTEEQKELLQAMEDAETDHYFEVKDEPY